MLPVDPAQGSFFAEHVRLSGSTLAVGAHQDSTAGTYAGSTYLFERDVPAPGAWGQRISGPHVRGSTTTAPCSRPWRAPASSRCRPAPAAPGVVKTSAYTGVGLFAPFTDAFGVNVAAAPLGY